MEGILGLARVPICHNLVLVQTGTTSCNNMSYDRGMSLRQTSRGMVGKHTQARPREKRLPSNNRLAPTVRHENPPYRQPNEFTGTLLRAVSDQNR